MEDRNEAQPTRRRILGMLGGIGAVGVATLAGCGDDGAKAASPARTAAGTTPTTSATGTGASTASTASTASSGTAAAGTATCAAVPQETAGPYPGDGTNGPNVLTQSGVVRKDIRSSFGSSTTTVAGVPLTVTMTVVDKTTCTPLAGAAVYAWHCDKDGRYSLYSQGVTGENFLRGVQTTDANGVAGFTTIFPGAYMGRWPHIHFEVFTALANATTGRNAKAISQLAMPEAACTAVYATAGYETSAKNFPQTPLKADNVFSDGWTTQTPGITGSASAGYTASIVIAV